MIYELSADYQIWVLWDLPQSEWWKEIDFRTSFLLTYVHQHKKKSLNLEIQNILETTKFPKKNINTSATTTLIGCKNHLPTDWLLLVHLPQNLNFNFQNFSSSQEQNLKSNDLSIALHLEIENQFPQFKNQQNAEITHLFQELKINTVRSFAPFSLCPSIKASLSHLDSVGFNS